MLCFQQVSFAYENNGQKPWIDHLSLTIQEGEFVAILGANGSGKSTIAKLMNGLLTPVKGEVLVDGKSTKDVNNLWSIRQEVGMVFQNPENQMVGSTVLDDVAFGLENIGFPTEQMMERIHYALEKVDMWAYRDREPHHLSGGQKQRVAIAGILAVKPRVIIFDEATSMLDPQGKAEIQELIKALHQEGITIITITHQMEEAMQAERVLLIQNGQVLKDAEPAQVFNDPSLLRNNQLVLPFSLMARERLRQEGLRIPEHIQTKKELVEFLWTLS